MLSDLEQKTFYLLTVTNKNGVNVVFFPRIAMNFRNFPSDTQMHIETTLYITISHLFNFYKDPHVDSSIILSLHWFDFHSLLLLAIYEFFAHLTNRNNMSREITAWHGDRRWRERGIKRDAGNRRPPRNSLNTSLRCLQIYFGFGAAADKGRKIKRDKSGQIKSRE